MFIPCTEREDSNYFEFQYCRNKWRLSKILKKGISSYWKDDSILVHVDDEEMFSNYYYKYLEFTNTPSETQIVDYFGVNYYTKEQTIAIIGHIKEDKPIEYEILIAWLEKAVTDYNGFYFLGL